MLRRRHFLFGALALGACRRDEAPAPTPTASASATATAPRGLPLLGERFTPLRDDFDATATRTRVVSLLSPT
jgi:hypothetical protein